MANLDGGAAITETVSMTVIGSQGDAVVGSLQATADGLPEPLNSSSGVIVMPPGMAPRTVQFTPGQNAILQSYDNRVTVNMPGGAYTAPLTLRHGYTPLQSEPPASTPAFKQGFSDFYLDATDGNGNAVHQLSQPLTITVSYTPQQLAALGLLEDDLTLFWYNDSAPDGGSWVQLPTSVDTQAHTATVSVNHFSTFQMSDGSSPSAAFLPSLQGWQVGLYNGDVSYQYPIDVPAGPAGMKPNINLSYDSTATDGIDGMRPKQQSGWVGKGWSLEPDYIGLNKLGSDYADTRFYTLVIDGQSYDVVRAGQNPSLNCGDPNRDRRRPCPDVINPSDWVWRTTNESFMKITAVYNGDSCYPGYPQYCQGTAKGGLRDNNDGLGWLPYKRYKWDVWTKSGVLYEFSTDVWQGWTGDTSPTSRQVYMEAYKWYLKSITDTHGNTITYTYARPTPLTQPTVAGMVGTVDEDIWLTQIDWGGNSITGAPSRYRVVFTSGSRPIDTDYNLHGSPYIFGGYSPHLTRQLTRIESWTNSNINYDPNTWESGYQTTGHYDLTYNTTSMLSDNFDCCPIHAVQPLEYKMALHSIQRYGRDGGSLPATTFTYGTDIGTGTWPLGSWNRLTDVDNGQGGTVHFEYENIQTVLGDGYGHLFKNNRRVTSKTEHSGTGQAWDQSYTWIYNYQEPGDVTRPAYNTIGTSHSDLGPNTYPNSAIVYYGKLVDTPTDHSGDLVHKWRTEFRGHRYVAETDPNGNVTEHWFYQGDVRSDGTGCPITATGNAILTDACWLAIRDTEQFKGKEYKTIVHDGSVSGPKLTETDHTYAANWIKYGYDSDESWAGIWRFFTYESQTQDKAWDSSASPLTKTTTYTYESTYGNLTEVDEVGGTGDTQRKTIYQYVHLDNGTSYIVDRKMTEDIKDGSSLWLARTVYGYDGYAPYLPPGSKGDLTFVRKFYNIPITVGQRGGTLPPTGYGTDTVYGYDPYGNQTTVTTYPQYSTTTGMNDPSPGWFPLGCCGTGRTTTTSYEPNYPTTEPAFHSFPMKVDPPTVNGVTLTERAAYDFRMGTITSVTDPNNNVSYARYDEFGRMTDLLKPGDTDWINPTVHATYSDWSIPFKYEVKELEVTGSSGVRWIRKFYDGMGREIQDKSEYAENNYQNIVTDKKYDGLGRVIQQSTPYYLTETSSTWGNYTPPNLAPNQWTSTVYDGLGRTRLTVAPDSTETWMTYTISSGLRSVMTEDANHHTTEHLSDMFGRLTQVVEYSGSGPSWTPYATTNYTYDPLDLLEYVQDAKGKYETMQYDSLGRKSNMTDLTMGAWTYDYNPDGSLAHQTDASSHTTTFSYDALGRTIQEAYYDGSYKTFGYDQDWNSNGQAKGELTSKYVYDAGNSLISNVAIIYNNRGEQTEVNTYIAGLTGDRRIDYAYDTAGRVTDITYPSNTDPSGREIVHYTYDDAWRQTSVCSTTYGTCYAHDATFDEQNQPAQYWLGNGLLQTYGYDSVTKRVTDMQVGPGLGLFNRHFTYDAVGNVQTIVNKALTPNQTSTYTYDEMDRLTRWQVDSTPAVDASYQYDLVGNITSKPGLTLYYNYALPSGAGGPYALHTQSGPNYSYDNNGNMTASPANGSDPARTYSWTPNNQPSQITSGGVTESYVYDADGQRLEKTRGVVTTYYIGGLYEEEQPTGTQRWYYTLNGKVVAQRELTPDQPSATPTSTLTSTPTNTPTNTPTATNTSTPTPTNTPVPANCQAVSWTNIVHVKASGNTIMKNGGTDGVWGDAGAVSTKAIQTLPPYSGGSVMVTADSTTGWRMFGLSNGDPDQNYNTINFALEMQNGGGIRIWENGVLKADQPSTYTTGDTLKITLEYDSETRHCNVSWYKIHNGVVTPLYTEIAPPITYPLLLDTTIYSMNAKVNNAYICSDYLGSSATYTPTPTGTPPTNTPTATYTPTPSGNGPAGSGQGSGQGSAGGGASGSGNTTPTPRATTIVGGGQSKGAAPNSTPVVLYISSDHLGSVSLVTNYNGTQSWTQEFDPWGQVRTGGTIGTQTRLNFTGQKLDDTGLLNYNARMYDPIVGRFVSPDTLVDMGWGRQSSIRPLTVNFNVVNFTDKVNAENTFTQEKGFWFQLTNDDRRKAKVPWGPYDPQALGRYTYVRDNPLRYTDPTGCEQCYTDDEALAVAARLRSLAQSVRDAINNDKLNEIAGIIEAGWIGFWGIIGEGLGVGLMSAVLGALLAAGAYGSGEEAKRRLKLAAQLYATFLDALALALETMVLYHRIHHMVGHRVCIGVSGDDIYVRDLPPPGIGAPGSDSPPYQYLVPMPWLEMIAILTGN
jgi:RHS repeat-associated protein